MGSRTKFVRKHNRTMLFLDEWLGCTHYVKNSFDKPPKKMVINRRTGPAKGKKRKYKRLRKRNH